MAEQRHDHEIEIEPIEEGRKGGEAVATGAFPMPRAVTVDWGAAVWAGIIAGAVFMMLEMLMVWLFMGASPWGPPRMIAAIVMGQGVLPPPATFDMGVMMAAMAVHFILSIVYALILAPVIARFDTGTAIGAGALFGFVLYLVNFYAFTSVFPWFANARNWVTVFSHIAFGLVVAWAYKGLAKPTDSDLA